MFSNFNFDLLNSPDFKEDSVREDLIMPILIKLGYSRSTEDAKILSHKGLRNPFYKIGSNKRQITEIPDYLLQTNGLSICVLDAKSPKEKCEDDGQVYGYAIHPEIRAKYFAMCNGREFVLWEKESSQNLLRFDLQEIDYYWGKLEKFLSPKNFNKPNPLSVEATTVSPALQPDFDYLNRPLPKEIPVKKQSTARHFGVHGYFTKQAWNIVSHYIKHFTQPGDLVLDPFVGSGVTSIESLMQARKTIGIDLNPLPVFIINSLCEPTDIAKLHEEFLKIKEKYENEENKIKEKPQEYLEKYKTEWQNLKNIKLDKTADVQTVAELFSSLQTAELAFLKHLIKKVKDKSIQNSLLLAFSSTVTKHNLTYHASSSRGENAGNAAAFAYYRYRVAKTPVELNLINSFENKVKKIISAKQEIKDKINQKTIQDLQVYKGDATDLNKVEDESVDYIYTDPPYGAKIAYLDLSAMWNAWLDLPVTEEDFEKEAIEGGSHNKTKHEYSDLIAKSISEMYRVLKFDRWMSFVFAHKDPHYWHIIVETAEKMGFEYAGAVKQANGQTSFKKRQNPFTVIAGQLIINFKKVRSPKNILKANLGTDIAAIVLETIEGIIAKNHGATLEEINDALVIQGLELGFLDILSKEYSDLTPILTANFDYDFNSQKYFIRENKKFRTHIPLELRIKYYLISLLNRREREKQLPTFDEICWEIIPLLKNGITPENQDILRVLEDIAERTEDDRWKIKTSGQDTLFS
jgi:16S rRNA G966 N2-methylase RsmD